MHIKYLLACVTTVYMFACVTTWLTIIAMKCVCCQIAYQNRTLGIVLLHCTGSTAGFIESVKDKVRGTKYCRASRTHGMQYIICMYNVCDAHNVCISGICTCRWYITKNNCFPLYSLVCSIAHDVWSTRVHHMFVRLVLLKSRHCVLTSSFVSRHSSSTGSWSMWA